MMSQELVTKANEHLPSIDRECPDCQSLLTIFYENGSRYFCENCDQEISARELDDNNISNDFEVESNRRLL